MKYKGIKELEDEKLSRLTGVKRSTFEKMREHYPSYHNELWYQ